MTLEDFFDTYNQVKIPLLQRDFVQSNHKKYDDFLTEIKNALEGDEKLHLGLIYGREDEINGEKIFYPIDGQQRLSTLCLVCDENKLCYENEIENTSEPNLENHLENDEIAKGIHPHIKAINKAKDEILKKEINPKNLSNITLDLVILDDFNLSDELYIKLNARGKALSEFDIFRAELLNYLKDDLKIEFANKIDNAWSEVFFKYFKEDHEKAFLRFYDFIVEHLLLLKKINKKNEYRKYDENIMRIIFSYIDSFETALARYEDHFHTTEDVFSNVLDTRISLDRLAKNKHFFKELLLDKSLNKQNDPNRIKWILFFYIQCVADGNIDCESFKIYARELNNQIQSLGKIWFDNGFIISKCDITTKVKEFFNSEKKLELPSDNPYFYLLEKHKYFYADVSLLEKCDYKQVYERIKEVENADKDTKKKFLKKLLKYADLKRKYMDIRYCVGYGKNEYDIVENLMLNILFINREDGDGDTNVGELKKQINNFFSKNEQYREYSKEDLISTTIIEKVDFKEERYGMFYINEEKKVIYMKNKQRTSTGDTEIK
nr:DUF262 domain-containing protein [Campylobacter sp. 2018MI01]